MPRPLPVWGFPNGYNPNLMGDVCEVCRASQWLPRPIPGQDCTAWTCAACTLLPQPSMRPSGQIPDD